MENKKRCISGESRLRGCIHDAAIFLQEEQLKDVALWGRFVEQYRACVDGENRGWRGEYWGKMMRGAVLVFAYTKDDALLRLLTASVRDMLTVMEPDGRVSTYSRDTEFDGWDLWNRKYVMLGMEYYLEICNDEALKAEIIRFLSGMLDYIMQHIGPGKKCITSASRNWLGLNASSILEPVVKLYRLTGERKHLEFAAYIIAEGGAEGVNIFELAYENKVMPYQYGVNKAYEMMSCFEGLLEYALITCSERYMTACVNFGKAILQTDVTVIGSCGCTHELLDHSTARQTAYEPGAMQETCVTVTWIKLCSRLLEVTGERCFADAMEKAFYNAYLGALNTEHKACDYIRYRFEEKNPVEGLKDTFLPFDSYSPLRAGTRGQLVGGLQLLPDKSYYGCCTSIGAAGVGIMTKHMVLKRPGGLSIEFYEKGSYTTQYRGRTIGIQMETEYPADGKIRIHTEGADGIKLYLRIPNWCCAPEIDCPYVMEDGYAVLESKSEFTLLLPMPVQPVYPVSWKEDVIWTNRNNAPAGWSSTGPQTVVHDPRDDRFIAFTRGPLTLCADSRSGKPADSVFSPVLPPRAKISESKEIVPGQPCMVSCRLQGTDGEEITLVDYASAGRDWKTPIAAWLQTQ